MFYTNLFGNGMKLLHVFQVQYRNINVCSWHDRLFDYNYYSISN